MRGKLCPIMFEFLAVILYLNFVHVPARILHEPRSEKEEFIRMIY